MGCSAALIVYAKQSVFSLNYVTMYHSGVSSLVGEQILRASLGMTFVNVHLFNCPQFPFQKNRAPRDPNPLISVLSNSSSELLMLVLI